MWWGVVVGPSGTREAANWRRPARPREVAFPADPGRWPLVHPSVNTTRFEPFDRPRSSQTVRLTPKTAVSGPKGPTMAIRRRNGVYFADIRITHPVTGERLTRRRSCGKGTSKKEARELEARWRRVLEAPREPTTPTLKTDTFRRFAWRWFEIHIETNSKPSYARSTEQILRVHLVPHFGDAELRTVSSEAVALFKARQAKKLAPKTVNNHLGALSRLFRSAVEWGYAERNPVKGVGLLKLPPQEFRFWDAEQSEAFLAKVLGVDPEWHAFFLCALRTGLRLGELFALRWGDVDLVKRALHVRRSWSHGHLTTPKSGRGRSLPVSPELASALHALRHLRGELVFCQADGSFLTRARVKHPFWRCTRRAGLPEIRLHDLRHSFASQLVMAGVPLVAVQQYLGHSDLAMTMRYAHLSPAARQDYVARLDGGMPQDVGQKGGHTLGTHPPIRVIPTR